MSVPSRTTLRAKSLRSTMTAGRRGRAGNDRLAAADGISI
jgi:hypothetical protein